MKTKHNIIAHIVAIGLLAVVPSIESQAQTTWKFIFTSDSRGYTGGINLTILKELVSEIRNHNVDFVLFAGDLVYGVGGTPSEFETQLNAWVQTMRPIYDNNTPIYVCRGNHELLDVWHSDPNNPPDPNNNFAIRWLKVFGSDSYADQKLPGNGPPLEKYMTYSVTHKNALIVALDAYAGTAHKLDHKINQSWLDSQLAANTKPHIFVAAHEPAFRTYHPDCLDDFPANRDALWLSITNAGARTYFCGHDHFYDHARVDNGDGNANNDIHQYIIGTAGARLYHWSPPYSGNNSIYTITQLHHAERHGYVLAEVNDLDVTLTWMQRSSNDLDANGVYVANETFSYTVTPKPIILYPNGGEDLAATNTYTIAWKITEGAQIDNIKIEYSLNNGRNWQDIASCSNIGYYEWDLPPADSNQCLIRISDANNLQISDISDSVFTIFQCQKMLTGDLNGDCYVDFLDIALLIEDWLKCGNPFDPACRLQQ